MARNRRSGPRYEEPVKPDALFYWAIMRRADGAFLPGGKGRGFTFDEPIVGCLPRLFRRKQDAKTALTHWLAGEYHVSYSRSMDFNGVDDYVSVHCEPKPNRRAEDMEVVRIKLTIDRE